MKKGFLVLGVLMILGVLVGFTFTNSIGENVSASDCSKQMIELGLCK